MPDRHPTLRQLATGLLLTAALLLGMALLLLLALSAPATWAAPAPAPATLPVAPPTPDPIRLLARLAVSDPPVSRVQAAAAAVVEQAVQDPTALAERRRLAALLPTVTAEVRRDQSSYRVVGLQGTSEVDYARNSPGTTVSLRATWELPDLWATRGEPSSVSVALSRLRRRDEAVQRATALYYERRRLQALLALDPPTVPLARAEAELELDRTTAELDVLTGGLYAGRGGP
jgi:hypothetical protein